MTTTKIKSKSRQYGMTRQYGMKRDINLEIDMDIKMPYSGTLENGTMFKKNDVINFVTAVRCDFKDSSNQVQALFRGVSDSMFRRYKLIVDKEYEN